MACAPCNVQGRKRLLVRRKRGRSFFDRSARPNAHLLRFLSGACRYAPFNIIRDPPGGSSSTTWQRGDSTQVSLSYSKGQDEQMSIFADMKAKPVVAAKGGVSWFAMTPFSALKMLLVRAGRCGALGALVTLCASPGRPKHALGRWLCIQLPAGH